MFRRIRKEYYSIVIGRLREVVVAIILLVARAFLVAGHSGDFEIVDLLLKVSGYQWLLAHLDCVVRVRAGSLVFIAV